MIFVTGGAWQGKTEFICRRFGISREETADGQTYELPQEGGRGPAVLTRFEALVRRWMKEGLDPEAETQRLLQVSPEMILIGDEIGCGIIPVDPFENEYRERYGRLCCRIAQAADQVYLVECGIGRRIK